MKLYELDSAVVFDALDQLFTAEMPPVGRFEWPRMQLLEAVLAHEPERGRRYWQQMSRQESGIRETNLEFDQMPFKYDGGAPLDALREMIVRGAKNDWELLTIGAAIVRNGRSKWGLSSSGGCFVTQPAPAIPPERSC